MIIKSTPKKINDKVLIALFHTHPNTMLEKRENGQYYHPMQSRDGDDTVMALNIPLIIKSHYGMYYSTPYKYEFPKLEKPWYKAW
ncbi:hypothetical protein [Leptospira santarosai]|uniref:hypothetical protein n=1 Tax=Leptospira santarosai TaxID=28183 RepID=UPI000519BA54|nr:hypothetical protein [Leptospira santarosai]